mgnify:FL=1
MVTLVNKLQLARSMPLTCAETGHVLLFDKKSPKSRAYVVNRARVSAMLHGLCHGVQARAAEGGFVHGGRNLEAEEPGAPVVMDGLIPTRTFHGRLYERYDGPDHEDGSRLHGRWFLRGGTPNRYYRDVRIDADRLQSLPEEGEPEALVQVELDGGIAEHTDLGPAAAQHELESEGGGLRAAGGGGGAAQVHGGGAAGDHGGGGDAGGGSSSGATVAAGGERKTPDETTATRSVIISIDEADLGAGIEARLTKLLTAVLGDAAAAKAAVAAKAVAAAPKPRHDWQPTSWRDVEGFFAMMKPNLFHDGRGDFTCRSRMAVALSAKGGGAALAEFAEHANWASDGRVAADPTLNLFLYNEILKATAAGQRRFLYMNKCAAFPQGADTLQELAAKYVAGDHSALNRIIQVGGNCVNTGPWWKERNADVTAIAEFRQVPSTHALAPGEPALPHSMAERKARLVKGHPAFKSNVEDVHRPVADLPAYFWTGSLPDNHLPGLMRLLRQHIEISRGAEAATLFDDDPQFRRRVMLDSQHVVTAYFDARQINYFNSVLVSVLQLDDAWWRYEGADGRGAIHTHLLGWSSRHARKVREALASSDDPSEQGLALYEWLQTSRADEPECLEKNSGAVSPLFFSKHPAGHPNVCEAKAIAMSRSSATSPSTPRRGTCRRTTSPSSSASCSTPWTARARCRSLSKRCSCASCGARTCPCPSRRCM